MLFLNGTPQEDGGLGLAWSLEASAFRRLWYRCSRSASTARLAAIASSIPSRSEPAGSDSSSVGIGGGAASSGASGIAGDSGGIVGANCGALAGRRSMSQVAADPTPKPARNPSSAHTTAFTLRRSQYEKGYAKFNGLRLRDRAHALLRTEFCPPTASFDVRPRPAPPTASDAVIPLAMHLFDSVYGRFAVQYPACQPLLKRLRAAGPNVEQELEAIRAEGVHQTFLARQLEAVRYYLDALIEDAEDRCLRSLPDQVTNYIDMLEDIEDWRVRSREPKKVCLVTFNYDTLLDRACRAVLGLKLGSPDAYIGGGDYIVLKLHGSLNWWEEVDSPGKELQGGDLERANQLIDLVGRYQRTCRYCMTGQDLVGWGPLRPAIAVPMVTKTGDDFACPQTHVRVLDQAIPFVSHLLVVGWRGAEGHFHDRWRRAASRDTVLQKALVVDASEKAAAHVNGTLKREMAIGGDVRWDWAIEGFSSFVHSSAVKAFLAAT